MKVLILSKRRQAYLFSVGIYPIEGFVDYYVNTHELRQAMDEYNTCSLGFGTTWTKYV